MLDWSDLRVLHAVAEMGSLSGAGRRLSINHATIGRRLLALEDALGAKLVDRLPRGAVLTPVGQEIAALAAQMQTLVETSVRCGRGEREKITGSVSISAPPLFASDVLAAGLAPLLAAYPALTVVLQSELSVVSLGRGEADIAVRLAKPEEASLVVRRIGTAALGLYANRTVAAQNPADWRFIGYDAGLAHVPHHRWFESFVQNRPVVLRTSDAHVQAAAARAGVGVAMLPCLHADHDADLVRVAEDLAPPDRAIWLVVHPDVRRSTAVRAVLDHVARLFIAREESLRSQPQIGISNPSR